MAEKLGSVRISPHVLTTIVRETTLAVEGVAAMHTDFGRNVDRLLKGGTAAEGVRVQIVDSAVTASVSIIAQSDVNLSDLGRDIQTRVKRAIKDMVGMPVLAVNVYIEDVERKAAG